MNQLGSPFIQWRPNVVPTNPNEAHPGGARFFSPDLGPIIIHWRARTATGHYNVGLLNQGNLPVICWSRRPTVGAAAKLGAATNIGVISLLVNLPLPIAASVVGVILGRYTSIAGAVGVTGSATCTGHISGSLSLAQTSVAVVTGVIQSTFFPEQGQKLDCVTGPDTVGPLTPEDRNFVF